MASKPKKLKDFDFDTIDNDLSFELIDPFEAQSHIPDGVDLLGEYEPPRSSPEEGVSYSGEFEHDTKQENLAIYADLKNQEKAARARLNAGLEVDFFFCVTFLDNAQRQAFLEATGWDKFGQRYLNGVELAKAMNIALPESAYKPSEGKPDKKLEEFALNIGF
jgi:hypothetical protein